MPFKKGNPGGPGGARPGAGRPSEHLREMCQELISKRSLVERLAKFGSGDRIQQVVTDQGEEIPVPATAVVQVKAIEILLDRAYGKPDQSINTNITQDGQRPDIAQLLGSIREITETLERLNGGSKVETGK